MKRGMSPVERSLDKRLSTLSSFTLKINNLKFTKIYLANIIFADDHYGDKGAQDSLLHTFSTPRLRWLSVYLVNCLYEIDKEDFHPIFQLLALWEILQSKWHYTRLEFNNKDL